MKKRNREDIKKIMGFDEDLIELIPELSQSLDQINPWVEQLPEIIGELNLRPGQIVLDVACGKGGVSIPLAEKYGVGVIGFDIVKEYIKEAKEMAKKRGVSGLCTFEEKDAREIVQEENNFDLLFWIAPPHLWKDSKGTIKSLRIPAKNGGFILIADAYLYSKTDDFGDYETLEDTNRGYTSFGDKIVKFIDYKDKLWEKDYQRTKDSAKKALEKAKNEKDKDIIGKYLKKLDIEEKKEKKHLGLAIWVIKVNKKV